MDLNRQPQRHISYHFNDVVKEIEDSGISSVCKTINKFNKIMGGDNLSSKNKDLEELIKNDISFAVEVLKVANSPLYRNAKRQEISDISNAIRQIGWDNIYQIGMTLTVKGLVKSSKTSSFANWMVSRAIAVANVSQIFLESLQTHNTELSKIPSIYAYGLTHDIGALGMLQVVKDYQQDIMEIKLKNTKANWSDAEQHIYGFDHTMLGEKILTDASLPRDFSIVARCHHAPNYKRLSSANAKKIALTRLAEIALVDKRHFSEHEAFYNLSEREDQGMLRAHEDFSATMRQEFKEQLGLTTEIYDEIRKTKLTDEYINRLYQQF